MLTLDTPIIAQDTDEDIPPGGVDEVAKALQAMKRGKAPGRDEVLVDVLKDGGDVILEQLAKLFTLCFEMYSQATATIHLHKDSDEFPINRGVRQGDTTSPKLFNAALEEIIRKLDWESNKETLKVKPFRVNQLNHGMNMKKTAKVLYEEYKAGDERIALKKECEA
nr:uncharacterized protein LOC129282156 [Lytechinus pictus]